MEGGCEGSSIAKEMRDEENCNHCLKSCIQEKIKRSHDIEAFESAKPEKFRIYRVSAALHELNEHAYSPRIVSIGPLHRGKEHLLAMEERKLSYMQCLFNRAGEKKEETLGNCVSALLKMESDARNCYAEEIILNETNFKSVKKFKSQPALDGADCDCNTEKFMFAEMMLIDGYFIIELLCRHHEKKDRYASIDYILRNTLQKSTIQDDLLLLENQIPFSILKKLYDLTVVKCIQQPPSLDDCVLSFFDSRIRITNTKPKPDYICKASQVSAHLLDFSHKIHVHMASTLAGSGEGETGNVHVVPTLAGSGEGETGNVHVVPSLAGSAEGEPGNVHVVPTLAGSGEGETGSVNRKKGAENPLNLSAMEIHLAGVDFKKKDQEESEDLEDLFSVKFEKWGSGHWYGDLFVKCCATGVLFCCPLAPVICILFICCLPCAKVLGRLCRLAEFQITPFSIYNYTELLLRNLIAYEQCCPDIESAFTSHAKFMDTLIDSAKDVELLEKAGVIQNHLGCSDEAAKLFNNLCKHIVVDNNNFYIHGLSEVEKYCTRRWPKNLKRLRRDYFGNPWSGIAVIATFFIFSLTLLQTIFTILSYHQ